MGRHMSRYLADRTGMVDFALRSTVERSSPTWVAPSADSGGGDLGGDLAATLWSWVDPEPAYAKTAVEMLQPDVDVGSCWPMQGSRGFAVDRYPLSSLSFLSLSLSLSLVGKLAQWLGRCLTTEFQAEGRGFDPGITPGFFGFLRCANVAGAYLGEPVGLPMGRSP